MVGRYLREARRRRLVTGNRLVTGETEEQLMARLRREAKEINAAVAREAAEAKARLRNELPGYDEPG